MLLWCENGSIVGGSVGATHAQSFIQEMIAAGEWYKP